MSRRKMAKRRGRVARPGRLRRVAAILVAVALVGGLLVGGLLFRSAVLVGEPPPGGPQTAAIVDQLSLTQPNPDFVQSATALLERAGYAVEYYPGEQVTVDFYRNLPAHGYDLIVLRVHAGRIEEQDVLTGQITQRDYVALYTGEPYDGTSYLEEEEQGLVGPGSYYEGSPESFTVGPRFIESSIRGNFDDALIVMMGCDGLRSQRAAQAFLDKGASAFVSWSQSVSASHTDAATERLLEKLLAEGLPVRAAVAQTAVEIGPDPFFGAELRILTDEG